MEVEVPIQIPDETIDRVLVDRIQWWFTYLAEHLRLLDEEGVNTRIFSDDPKEERFSIELAIEGLNLFHTNMLVVKTDYYRGNIHAENYSARYESQGRVLRAIAEKYGKTVAELAEESLPEVKDKVD